MVIAICSNHGCRETKRDGLQHQVFGGVSCFEANVAMPSVSVFCGGALKDCGNADACRSGRDPILTEGGVDERFRTISWLCQKQLVAANPIAIDTGVSEATMRTRT